MKEKYSRLRFAPRVNLNESIPLAFPLSVYIEPTNRCNFKCKFCPESFDNFQEITGGFHFLNIVDMNKIIQELLHISHGKGVKTINFYMMGEPLMNVDTPTFIQMARDAKVSEKIILTSNGSLLKGERAKRLAESPPDYLRISIYGPNSSHHREITASRIPLDDIRDNLLNFRKLVDSSRCQIYVKMIDQGIEKNSEFMSKFHDCGDDIAIEPVMNWNDPEEGNLSGMNQDELLKQEYFSLRKRACPSPFYTSVIHSDLNVSVCCVDWSKKAVVGNLKVSSLEEIWNGSRLKNFQRLHLEDRRTEIEACRNCTYIHTFPDNIDGVSLIQLEKKDKNVN